MKNIGIVGYGSIAPVHAAAIEKCENAGVYAVCDIRSARLDKCRETYDVLTYDDYDKMLCDENIDGVHICTPHYLHFEMIKKALAAGKEVVCEKPITMTKKEFYELLALEDSKKVCVILQNRLNPCVVKLKELLQGGELGAVKSVKSIVTWHRTWDYYKKDAWRGKWDTEGGGVLINQAIHTLDYFSYITGGVSSVKAQMMNFSIEEIEVEDTFSAYFKLNCGAKGVFFATNAYGNDSAPQFEVVMERGIVRYVDGKLFLGNEMIEEDDKPSLGKAYWGKGHELLMKDYYDESRFFSPQDVKNTMDTMFAMYESARSNGKEIVCT